MKIGEKFTRFHLLKSPWFNGGISIVPSFHANIINDALVAAYEQGAADRDNES